MPSLTEKEYQVLTAVCKHGTITVDWDTVADELGMRTKKYARDTFWMVKKKLNQGAGANAAAAAGGKCDSKKTAAGAEKKTSGLKRRSDPDGSEEGDGVKVAKIRDVKVKDEVQSD